MVLPSNKFVSPGFVKPTNAPLKVTPTVAYWAVIGCVFSMTLKSITVSVPEKADCEIAVGRAEAIFGASENKNKNKMRQTALGLAVQVCIS
jgi:hypothetical protein